MKRFLIAVGFSLTVGCDRASRAPEEQVDLQSDRSRLSYALGYNAGSELVRQGTEIDPSIFVSGLQTALEAKVSLLTPQEARDAIQKNQEAQKKKRDTIEKTNLERVVAFLESNRGRPGIRETGSGLQYEVLENSSSKIFPKPDAMVAIHYKTFLEDGTLIEDTSSLPEPVEVALDRAIPAWREGLPLLNVGSKAKFYISPQLGYGSQPPRPIPPGTLLIQEVHLVNIRPRHLGK